MGSMARTRDGFGTARALALSMTTMGASLTGCGDASGEDPFTQPPGTAADAGVAEDDTGGPAPQDDEGTGDAPSDDGTDASDPPTDDTGTDAGELPPEPFGLCHTEQPPAGAPIPPPPPAYSGGVCPAIAPGYVTNFLSQGRQREFAFVVPSDYDPARTYPLVFAWYHLSGNAMDFVSTIGAQTLADQTQMMLVVPQATGDFQFVWPDTPLDNGEAQVDLGFFDDLLACVSEQYAVNASCVASAGVSAGGLWTAFLGQRRGQYLASNLAFSGGYPTEFGAAWWPWMTSPHRFASLVLWGGPSDELGLNFHEASLRYIDELKGDNHFLVRCEHSGGHGAPPPEPGETEPPFAVIFEFILDHPYWLDGTSPLQAEGIPPHWPSYCVPG